MTALSYGDVMHMHASSHCLHALDTVCIAALRFITHFKAPILTATPFMLMLDALSCPSGKLKHWHIFTNKTVLASILPMDPSVTVFAPRTYPCSAWNQLQNDLNLQELFLS